MRFCSYCTRPMYSSNYSVWIGNINFEIHRKCEEMILRTALLCKENPNFKKAKLQEVKII